MNRKLAFILIAVLTVSLVVMGCKPEDQRASAQQDQPAVIAPDVIVNQVAAPAKDTVSVSGSGKVTLKPDMAKVTLGINSRAATMDEAQQRNAETVEAVLESLRANGIEEADIKTNNVRAYEEYDYDSSPAKVVGYVVNTTLDVTIRKIDNVGKVIGDALASGATSTNGPYFSLADSSIGYANALKAAIADAQSKAAAVAGALGVTFSEIPVKVTETSASYQPLDYDSYSRDEVAAPQTDSGKGIEAPISAGEIEVSASVTVEYELLPLEADSGE